MGKKPKRPHPPKGPRTTPSTGSERPTPSSAEAHAASAGANAESRGAPEAVDAFAGPADPRSGGETATPSVGAPLGESAAADETASALAKLRWVFVCVLLAAALPYAAPQLRRLRALDLTALVAGPRGVPVVRHFFEPTERGDAPAGSAANASNEPAAELGSEVAAGLAAVPDARRHGEHVTPDEYAGLEHRLVDRDHRGMRPFYEALLRTAEREPGAITRVSHYGDSSIAIDTLTSTVRRDLQLRFGDAGHGFVLVSKGYMAYRHVGLEHSSSGNWQVQEVTRSQREDGRYGFGGIVLRGGGGTRARFGASPDFVVGKSVSRFELWYATGPRLGQVELRLDDGAPRVVDTRADSPGESVEVVTAQDGDHDLSLRALGTVELYGMVLERDVPGVVYDSLGLVGARANRLLNFDAAHIRSQLARRRTNLLVLGFGGNEASDAIDPARYEADFAAVVERMRGDRTDLGCLVVAPLDQAGDEGRGLRTFRSVPHIVEAQRRVAERLGCAFFDTFHAMGGEGSMVRWYRVSPRLASGDFRHATPEGYEVIGNLLYKAILEGFARYLHDR